MEKTKETHNKKKFEDLKDGDYFKPHTSTGQTIKYWCDRADLRAQEKLVLCILLAHDGEDGCYPGQKTIAAMSSISTRWIKKILQKLKAKGYLEFTPSKGSGQKTHYTFIFREHHIKGELAGSPFNDKEKGNSDNIKGELCDQKRGTTVSEKGNQLVVSKDFKELKGLKEKTTTFVGGGGGLTTFDPSPPKEPSSKEKEESLESLADWLNQSVFCKNETGFINHNPRAIIKAIKPLIEGGVEIDLIKEVCLWNEQRNPFKKFNIRAPIKLFWSWPGMLESFNKDKNPQPKKPKVSKRIMELQKVMEDQYREYDQKIPDGSEQPNEPDEPEEPEEPEELEQPKVAKVEGPPSDDNDATPSDWEIEQLNEEAA